MNSGAESPFKSASQTPPPGTVGEPTAAGFRSGSSIFSPGVAVSAAPRRLRPSFGEGTKASRLGPLLHQEYRRCRVGNLLPTRYLKNKQRVAGYLLRAMCSSTSVWRAPGTAWTHEVPRPIALADGSAPDHAPQGGRHRGQAGRLAAGLHLRTGGPSAMPTVPTVAISSMAAGERGQQSSPSGN